ncbi:37S ribosomal protein S22 [Sporothrix bragantina]|uniref:37S ribosomal protein S22 n=1 Tax=Sporothrix bragantina TaxID=671064 RepID=A0ABP0B6M1_9PEZI
MVTTADLNRHAEECCTGVTQDKKYFEAGNAFIKRTLRHIPLPRLLFAYEDDGVFTFGTELVPGVSMKSLTDDQKAVVALELKQHIATLKALRSDTPGVPGLAGQKLLCAPNRVHTGFWKSHSCWRPKLSQPCLSNKDKDEDEDYVFCHNDLGQHNVLVDPETLKINTIIDWEYGGFWPFWFERPYWERPGPSAALQGEEDDTERCRSRLLEHCDEVEMPHMVSFTKMELQIRPFSSSRATRQEAQPDNDTSSSTSTSSPTDMETVVRQARATFGDTLPKDFLTADELKLYERLFGSPIRETRPEDVGVPLAERELNAALQAEPKRNLLFRETEGGFLEEVAWRQETTEREATAETGKTAHAADGALLENLLTDAQIEYIQASARNEREYEALTKLQQDFVVAQMQAKEEERARELAEEQEEEEDGDALPIDQEEYLPEEYEAVEEEVLDEEERGEDGEDVDIDTEDDRGQRIPRVHPLTKQFRSRTDPSTIQLPKAHFVQPITELLRRTDIKHVRQAAEKAFGGPELPYSPRSPSVRPGRNGGGNFAQKPVAMEAGHHRMSDIEADAYMATVLPAVYATSMSTLTEVRRRLGPEWIEALVSKKSGNPRVLDVGGGGAALAAWNQVFRSEVALMREKGTFAELFPEAAEKETKEGEVEAEAEETEMKKGKKTKGTDSDPATSSRRKMERAVVVGSDTLRYRLSRFLHNTSFLPRLPDLLHSAENVERHLDAPAHPKARKTYDVILASHLLMPLDKPYQRRALLDNLWAMLNPNGGVLIVVEKGHPRGFEAVADARQRLLDRFIQAPEQAGNPPPGPNEPLSEHEDIDEWGVRKPKEPGMIIAPCTNHNKCPMYLVPGLTHGRKDFCHFSQRFSRPPFLQRILGQTHHNHEDVDFSYIAVQRGTPASDRVASSFVAPPIQGQAAADAAFAGFGQANGEGDADADVVPPHPLTLPRTILPPLKRRGHVILDVCTPAGQIERWTVPKSRGKQAYHDARKAQWGDLWPLGAKTRVPRTVRLGRGGAGGAGGGAEKERSISVNVEGGQMVSAKEGGRPGGAVAGQSDPVLRQRDKKKYGKTGTKKRSRKAEAQSVLQELRAEMHELPYSGRRTKGDDLL